jgi:hypothetical protein
MLQPHSPDGDHRGLLLPIRCQPLPALCARTNGQAGGLIRLSGRIPARRGLPINHLVAGAAPSPADPGKAGCSQTPGPGITGLVTCQTRKAPPEPLTLNLPALPAPPPSMISSRGGARHGRPYGRRPHRPGPAPVPDTPARSQNPAATRGREHTQGDCNFNGSVALSVVTVCDLIRGGCGGAAG